MSRQTITLLLVIATLLAACVASSPTNPPTTATLNEATGATRTITHALGESTIPVNPQRIAVVGYNEVEELVALGITPIAALYPPPEYLPDAAQQIPLIGNDAGQPNLEKLLALKPDLILGVEWAMTDIYDELSQIAPSVAVPRPTFAAWKEALRFTADVVNRSAEAEALLVQYDARVAEVRAAIGPEKLAETEVTAFRPYTDGSGFLIWIDRSFCDGIMAEVGIRRPEAQRAELPADAERIDDLSLEKIPLLDVDVIFLALPESGVFKRGANEGLIEWITTIETSPLWAQLRAVQNGQVFKVDTSVWNEGSIFAANGVLDDLERYLGTGDATTAPQSAATTRTVTHALGETEVPANPQRIVSLEHELTDTLLALGRPLIGSARNLEEIAALAPLDTAEIALVGDWPEVNLETILRLKPDLIVLWAWRVEYQDEKLYETLSQIAPTVVLPDSRDWRTDLENLAVYVNAEAEAAQLLAAYDERVAALREQLQDTTVSLVRPRESAIGLYGPGSNPGRILTDLGLDVQEVPDEMSDWSGDGTRSIGEASLEWIPNISSDHVFMISYDIPEGDTPQTLLRQPIWQTVPAVEAGNVHPIHGQAWTNHGYHGVMLLIDEVEAALLTK
jgi:iron complex transport system substrate-binding protein